MQVDVSQIRKGDGRWIFLTSDIMNEFPEHFTEFDEGLRRRMSGVTVLRTCEDVVSSLGR